MGNLTIVGWSDFIINIEYGQLDILAFSKHTHNLDG